MKLKRIRLSLEISVPDYVAQYRAWPRLLHDFDFLAGINPLLRKRVTLTRKLTVRYRETQPKLERRAKKPDPSRFCIYIEDQGLPDYEPGSLVRNRLVKDRKIDFVPPHDRRTALRVAMRSYRWTRLFVLASNHSVEKMFCAEGEEPGPNCRKLKRPRYLATYNECAHLPWAPCNSPLMAEVSRRMMAHIVKKVSDAGILIGDVAFTE